MIHERRDDPGGDRSTKPKPAIAMRAPGIADGKGHSLRNHPANKAANNGVIRPKLVVNTAGNLSDATPKANVGTAVDTTPNRTK
jgi:hypothetical protein